MQETEENRNYYLERRKKEVQRWTENRRKGAEKETVRERNRERGKERETVRERNRERETERERAEQRERNRERGTEIL